ncbi:MAG: type 4a pilus biogenesis protein PilO [Gammaproteobacteria bacterium]|nr:type 4a pilus biogenesis protein PilO [Gammaproteobacteria bacterium]
MKGNIDFGNIDFNNVGSWPTPLKIVVILVACVLVGIIGFFAFIQGKRVELQAAETTEVQLKKDITDMQAKANNLDELRKQIDTIEETLKTILDRALPKKTEVDALLDSISEKGMANGVKFLLFKPQGERFNGPIAEYPVQMRVTGGYHEFGGFVSDVAALPRIVTLHDISITDDKRSKKLTMDLIAKTYRYLEQEELQSQKNPKDKTKLKK